MAELGTSGDSTLQVGLIATSLKLPPAEDRLPTVSQKLHQLKHRGEKMPPPHTPQNAHMHSSPGLYLKTRTPPSHPSGLHGTSLSQEQSTDKLTLPR